MKNIRKKAVRIGICIGICLCFGIKLKVSAADEQWFRSQLELAMQEGNVYVVAQDGTGDFMSIQEGVDTAESGDTLVICPGVYTETVEIMAKTVNLLGVDRDTCVLAYDTADYNSVPLTIASGSVRNLTIRGYASVQTDVSTPILTEELQWQEPYSGYTVHIDQNYLYGRELSFENCRIESYNSYCLGIGMRGESSITLTDCEIAAAGKGGCIFAHDVDALEVGGECALIIRSSSLQSSVCPYIMTINALSRENHINLTFQGVRVYGVAYEDEGGYDAANMNNTMGVESANLHILSVEDTIAYMEQDMQTMPVLEEGVTYIGTKEKRRYVFNVLNMDGLSGEGWCGLSNTWLTQDSFGNTLQDMNFVYTKEPITAQPQVLTDLSLYNTHSD